MYAAYLIIAYFKQLIHFRSWLAEIKNFFTKKMIALAVVLVVVLLVYLPGVILRVVNADLGPQLDYFQKYIAYLQDAHTIVFYFALMGVVLALSDFKRKSLLVLAYLIPLFIISYHVILIHFRYLFFIFPILIFFSGYAFLYLADLGAKVKFRKTASVAVSLILVFFVFNSHALVFKPQKEYTLESETPQPDFKAAFQFVKDGIKDEDIVITPYTVLSRIYLRDPDYSVDYNPSGVYLGSITIVNSSVDVFTNHTSILNATAFDKVIFNKSGYVVVDKFSLRRMDKAIAAKIQNLRLIKDMDKDIYTGVKVYGWP